MQEAGEKHMLGVFKAPIQVADITSTRMPWVEFSHKATIYLHERLRNGIHMTAMSQDMA